MRKIIPILLFLICSNCFAQDIDTIYHKDGFQTNCKISKININDIQYTKTAGTTTYASHVDRSVVLKWYYGSTGQTIYSSEYDKRLDSIRLAKQDTIKHQIQDTLKYLFDNYSDLNKKTNRITSNNDFAGWHLLKASWNAYGGMFFSLAGVGLSLTSAALLLNNSIDYSTANYLSIAGGGCQIVAGICFICVPIQIEKAGKYLQRK
jgi:hypothetical protein